jgi:transcription elongation factor SPT5
MDEESLQDPEEYKDDEIVQQGRQPSITDPKLWLIKCKIGKERDSVNNLYHKYFTLENTKQPLKYLL